MPLIVAAPFFLLLLAASGRAIDSSRSLLSVRDVENIWAEKKKHKSCKLQHGTHNLHVYHIYQGDSKGDGGWTISERNAGNSAGDLSYIFPRGFRQYYKNGYIAMVHASYNQWGQYLQCHHHGTTHYSCNGGSYDLPGMRSLRQGTWYSFPKAGSKKTWWQGHNSSYTDKTCGYIRISAKCLFNLIAKTGGRCPNGCHGISYDECSTKCMGGLSLDQEHQIWNHAIWNNGCYRHKHEKDGMDVSVNDDLNATSESDDPVMPEGFFTNTSVMV